MIQVLKRRDYEKVRSLFTEISVYNASLPALLDGTIPGWVVVDAPERPRSALAATAEGHFLAGDSTDEGFVTRVNAHLATHHMNDEPTVAGDGIYLRFHPRGWEDHVAALFRPRAPMTLLGRHYLLTELRTTDWRDRLPESFSVRRIDAAFLEDPELAVPGDLHEQLEENWETRGRYLEHGFGCAAIREDSVSHWSLADCATKDGRCEIGIWSTSENRRLGLASITTAACVELALSIGFDRVGWQCLDSNVASWKTAERVGFVHERTSTSFYCMLSSVHQEAECGWYHLRNGRPRESANAFDRLFAREVDLPPHVFHTAARAYAAAGRPQKALENLRSALDQGWTHTGFTLNHCPEFESLFGTPGWEALLGPRSRGGP
jgi:RimJ/RimL family protein N-acetyltransferase